jgi:Putative Actinobacterial Holin-X, holin superfamily III
MTMIRATERAREQQRAATESGWTERALNAAGDRIAGFREAIEDYVAFQAARLKRSVFETSIAIAGWIIALTVAVVVLSTGIVFALVGAAGAVASATGRAWAGYLSVGVMGLLVAAVVLTVARRALKRKLFQRRDDGASRPAEHDCDCQRGRRPP